MEAEGKVYDGVLPFYLCIVFLSGGSRISV